MNSVQVSLEIARRMALHAQLFGERPAFPDGKEGIAQTIERLGYVQIDTISVVQRAHQHTLWTRRPDYDPKMLHELQAVDRRVFEYWGHAASYLPMADYRFYIPRMRSFRAPVKSWEKYFIEKHEHLTGPVLKRIQQEGPLSSKDFKPPPGMKRGEWWDWKPAKGALEVLFWRGELMVKERRSFQRVYDLTERVLPSDVDTRSPEDNELGRFLVHRALAAYGVAQEKEIREHIHGAGRKVINQSIADMVDANEVIPVKIGEVDGADYYALPKMLEQSADLGRLDSRVWFLSPFDNLVIQRERIKHLFAFEYTLECYLQPAKRKYGYFSLPILWCEQFVGRLDPKADRKKKVLIIRNLVFEPEFIFKDEFLAEFLESLKNLMLFNQCESVELENVIPKKSKSAIRRLLKIMM
jgi:uncharacterized protein YcaQ